MKVKIIKDRLVKECSICGKKFKLILYVDSSYRGGHYFGKLPISTKKELARAMAAGTRSSKIGGHIVQVLKEDPKPYKYAEYWECSKCYN